MKIVDTTPTFFKLYATKSKLEIEDIEQGYYQAHPDVFALYFPMHCPPTEERLQRAIQRYAQDLEKMKQVTERLPAIIREIMQEFASHFGVELDLQFNLLVGGYGSNAFVEPKIIGQITFAIEKLSPEPNHLRVIVAHEIAHIYHHYLSDQAQLAWKEVQWEHGLTTLYREGVATYISMQIVKDLPEAVYFSYDDEGKEWFDFAQQHVSEIMASFLQDVRDEWTMDKEKEWFRLSGGAHFGFNRLGYYLGTRYVQHLVQKNGEENAITYWATNKLHEQITSWLEDAELG